MRLGFDEIGSAWLASLVDRTPMLAVFRVGDFAVLASAAPAIVSHYHSLRTSTPYLSARGELGTIARPVDEQVGLSIDGAADDCTEHLDLGTVHDLGLGGEDDVLPDDRRHVEARSDCAEH